MKIPTMKIPRRTTPRKREDHEGPNRDGPIEDIEERPELKRRLNREFVFGHMSLNVEAPEEE